MSQVFTLNVFNTGAGAGPSILNMTGKQPNFQVEGLQSEKTFSLTVHSSNLRGESERVRLVASTDKPPAQVTSTQDINQVRVGGPGVNWHNMALNVSSHCVVANRSSLLNQAKIGSLKTRLIISPVLGVLIGVGGAIILVSITLFAIMCCRVKYERVSRQLLGRGAQPGRGDEAGALGDEDLYVDLTDNSPDLIPNDGEPEATKYFYLICEDLKF